MGLAWIVTLSSTMSFTGLASHRALDELWERSHIVCAVGAAVRACMRAQQVSVGVVGGVSTNRCAF